MRVHAWLRWWDLILVQLSLTHLEGFTTCPTSEHCSLDIGRTRHTETLVGCQLSLAEFSSLNTHFILVVRAIEATGARRVRCNGYDCVGPFALPCASGSSLRRSHGQFMDHYVSLLIVKISQIVVSVGRDLYIILFYRVGGVRASIGALRPSVSLDSDRTCHTTNFSHWLAFSAFHFSVDWTRFWLRFGLLSDCDFIDSLRMNIVTEQGILPSKIKWLSTDTLRACWLRRQKHLVVISHRCLDWRVVTSFFSAVSVLIQTSLHWFRNVLPWALSLVDWIRLGSRVLDWCMLVCKVSVIVVIVNTVCLAFANIAWSYGLWYVLLLLAWIVLYIASTKGCLLLLLLYGHKRCGSDMVYVFNVIGCCCCTIWLGSLGHVEPLAVHAVVVDVVILRFRGHCGWVQTYR